MKDLLQNTEHKQSIDPAEYTSDQDGSSVDLKNAERAMIEVPTGLYTDGTFTFELQESDDDSNWSTVNDADIIGSEPVIDSNADEDQVHRFGYKGSKRYIRVTFDVTDSPATGVVVGAAVLKGQLRYSKGQAPIGS